MGIIGDDAPKRRRVGLIYDETMCKHSDPDNKDHVENPDRIRRIWNRLNDSGLAQRCIILNAEKAKDSHLALVHSKDHIRFIKTVSSTDSVTRSDAAAKLDSIYFNEGSSEASLLAAGSVIKAAEEVGKGELDYAFAIVRPPGHHAEEDEAMGFCNYNNVAIASSFLLNRRSQFGIGKILIVDWDVHHGNGTQKMFYKDPRVLVFSVHRHDSGRFYPCGNDGSYDMIGEGLGAGYNINIPWEHGGYGDADYFAVWDQILIPVAKEFNPDIIMISAGFDAALGDPLGGCRLSPFGYSVMLDKLMDIGSGKIVMALEGGYDPISLVSSAQACVEVLLRTRPIIRCSNDLPDKSTELVIQAVCKALSAYWPVLGVKLPDKVINSIPSQTEEIADADAYRTVQANSVVEPVHVADKQTGSQPETGGSPPSPTSIELQPPGLTETPIIETEEPLVSHKGKRPSVLLQSSFSGKRPRVTVEEPTAERNWRDNFSVLECEDPKQLRRYVREITIPQVPKQIRQHMRETALPRDKEIFSKMSYVEKMDLFAYWSSEALVLCSGLWDDHNCMQAKIDQQRKEIEALKSESKHREEARLRAVEEAELLKATCQSLKSRGEELEREVSRANEKFNGLVKKSEKNEIDWKKRYTEMQDSSDARIKQLENEIKNLHDEHGRDMDKAQRARVMAFNAFPSSPTGLELAEAYRERLMHRYHRSAHFLKTATPFVKHYVRKALKNVQSDIAASGSDLVLDVKSIVDRIPNKPGWEGNPKEEADFHWGQNIYQELVNARKQTQPPQVILL